MKKGFTLIELLAVIILLAIVSLIATPIVLNVIDDAKDSANKRSIEGYARAIKEAYYNEQVLGKTPEINDEFLANIDTSGGRVTCVSIAYSEEYGVILNKCQTEEKLNKDYCYLGESHYDCNNKDYLDKASQYLPTYADNSGANKPKLYDNMIPVKYDGNNWVYAYSHEEWYNYDNKEWANAVVLNDGVTKKAGDTISESDIALWYVWIPRYTYTIFNGNNEGVPAQVIEVKFENGTNSSGTVKCVDNITTSGETSETCTDSTNGSIVNGVSTYTHPAFTFGDEQLTGFWVGKFEISGTTDLVTIKPGVSSLRNQTVSVLYNTIKQMKEDYRLNGDSHMIKNMEWGAIVYLKQSKYGLGLTDIVINDNSNYLAGGGDGVAYKTNISQSTTGNIYGVYDISGNSFEYTMGNMIDSNGNFYIVSSGFTSAPEDKYYDKYSYGPANWLHARGKLGDATKETLITFGNNTGGWYNDYAYIVSSGDSWFHRGGFYGNGAIAGAFSFSTNNGSSNNEYSSRAILS